MFPTVLFTNHGRIDTEDCSEKQLRQTKQLLFNPADYVITDCAISVNQMDWIE